MKIAVTAALAVVLACFAMTNCTGNKQKSEACGISFDSIVADTVVHLTNDNNSPTCRISLHMKYATGENGEKINDTLMRCGILSPDYLSLSPMKLSTQQAVDSFINRYIEDYRSFYTQIYRDDKTTQQADLAYKLNTTIKEGKNGIICYTAEITNKMGVAETTYKIVKNILASNGHVVSLEDVFVAGAEKRLSEIISEQLCKDIGSANEEELFEKGYFLNGSVYASRNFVLDDDGIDFIYITGEIADRSKGEITIRIDYSDVKKLMKQWN